MAVGTLAVAATTALFKPDGTLCLLNALPKETRGNPLKVPGGPERPLTLSSFHTTPHKGQCAVEEYCAFL